MAGIKKVSGSLTIYMTLVLISSIMFILALLELSRVYGIQSRAQEVTNLAVESAFGSYQPLLFRQYDIFGLDKNQNLEEEMLNLARDNLNDSISFKGADLYGMKPERAEIISYELLTDGDGTAFMAQVASFMKQEMGEEAAKKCMEKLLGIQSSENNNQQLEQKMDTASQTLQQIEEAEKQAIENVNKSSGMRRGNPTDVTPPKPQNPMETVKGMKQQGILSVLLPGQENISASTIDNTNSLLTRSVQKGNYHRDNHSKWYERVLLQEYTKTRFGTYQNPNTKGSLNYEQEYILCGEESDKKNLEETAEKLLLLRGVVNYTYLLTDTAKQAEALALATTLAGITANPGAVEIVRQGIIAAWALAESIWDVRSLMAGGKVPLIKTSQNFKVQLSNLLESSSGSTESDSEEGCSYEEYLQGMLYLMPLKSVTYRIMDLMEYNLHQVERYRNVKMDDMVNYMNVKIQYQAKNIFLSVLGSEYHLDSYNMEKSYEFSYIP